MVYLFLKTDDFMEEEVRHKRDVLGIRFLGTTLGATLILFSAEIAAQFAGGDGLEQNPWQIENAEHSNNVRQYLGADCSDSKPSGKELAQR